MLRNKYNLAILLVLSLLIGIISCKEDDENRRYSYPTDVTIGIINGSAFSIDPLHQDWKVEIDNPEIIDVTLNENDLSIIPKKMGATKFLVFDGNEKELFRTNVEIVETKRLYRIDRLAAIVEIIDESFKDLIDEEIECLYPHGVGTVYELTYYTKTDGKLYVHPVGESYYFEGTFAEKENDTIVFHYDGPEQYYINKFIVDKSKPEVNIEDIDIYFIKDYTLYFREKYPEAGVFKVDVQQITKYVDFWANNR